MKPQPNGVAKDAPKFLNIACGGTYLAVPEWENVDYTPDESGHVTKMNVLHKLEPSQARYEAVYCSHFVEHIPYGEVPRFLKRCRSLVAPGGLLRIVVPDAEFLLREFLRQKDAGNNALAEYAYVNFLDQCVRRERGGRLGALYEEIKRGQHAGLVEYATYLNGGLEFDASAEVPLGRPQSSKRLKRLLSPNLVAAGIERRYVRFVCSLLPRGFRSQNVSFADVGELHHWMYDFDQLSRLLKHVGFAEVSRLSFDSSRRADGTFLALDALNGGPRKGHHQLFIEAYP